jgi:hypothetical protein
MGRPRGLWHPDDRSGAFSYKDHQLLEPAKGKTNPADEGAAGLAMPKPADPMLSRIGYVEAGPDHGSSRLLLGRLWQRGSRP